MYRHTASGLAREEACIASVVLPRTHSVGNKYSRKGNVWHAYLKNVNGVGKETALRIAGPEWRDRLNLIDLERLPVEPSAYAAEVAFAYCSATDTARELGRGLSREEAYALAQEHEDHVGTADVVGLTENGVVILDWKTGWADFGPMEDFLQLLAYAVMAARAYGKDEATIGIIRLRDDGSSYFDTATLDTFALDEAAARLRTISERATAARKALAESAMELPDPVEGDHCRYCPSFVYCPAKAQLVNRVGDAEFLVQPLTPETVAKAWDRLKLTEQVLARVEKTLKEYATENPVPLADGTILGPVEVTRREIDAALAEPVLEAKYGLVFSMEAVEVTKSATLSSIDSAVRKVLLLTDPRLKLKKTNDLIWEELVQAGAARVRKTTQIKPHKPSKQLSGGTPNGLEAEPAAGQHEGAAPVRETVAGEAHGEGPAGPWDAVG